MSLKPFVEGLEDAVLGVADVTEVVRGLPDLHGEEDCRGDDGAEDELVGESSENNPLASDNVRPCRLLRSCTRCRDVISILPPPTIGRLSSRMRSAVSALACSGDIVTPGRGVTERVPRSCAYE